MLKKASIGIVVVVLLAAIGALLFVRSILATDTVRIALASQISKAIGQPVTVRTIDATIYPRVTVNLGDVGIGDPERIHVRTLQVGTDFRALLSRRIVHGTVRLNGGRIELPLPASSSPTDTAGSPEGSGVPVELVSIDEIVLRDVQVVSGGHTLRADIEAMPEGKGLSLHRISLAAGDTLVTGSGRIEDLSGPVGKLTLKSDRLDFERLLTFAGDFSRGSGLNASTSSTATGAARKPASQAGGMDIALELAAVSARLGTLVLDHLAGTARVIDKGVTIDPIRFGLFRGRYEGSMALAVRDAVDLHLKASLSGVDLNDAMAFAGSPHTISGTLTGRMDLRARGADPTAIAKSARGTIRVDARDGVVKNLGLLRAIVLATSMRSDSTSQTTAASKDEPFSLFGATLRLAGGAATTDDLVFESPDFTLTGAGSLTLPAPVIDVKGRIQLSEALSQKAGRDLYRYTQEQGRVTLPAAVAGPPDNLSVQIDLADAAQRALKNRLNEELQKVLKKGLGGFQR